MTDWLGEIEARAEAAWPGPWESGTDNVGNPRVSGNRYIVAETTNHWLDSAQVEANTEFIKASRQDVPDLCKALRKAWARIEQLESEGAE